MYSNLQKNDLLPVQSAPHIYSPASGDSFVRSGEGVILIFPFSKYLTISRSDRTIGVPLCQPAYHLSAGLSGIKTQWFPAETLDSITPAQVASPESISPQSYS